MIFRRKKNDDLDEQRQKQQRALERAKHAVALHELYKDVTSDEVGGAVLEMALIKAEHEAQKDPERRKKKEQLMNEREKLMAEMRERKESAERKKIVANDTTIHHIVKRELYRLGDDADLNHIDVSQVTDMHHLFRDTCFCGDISQWDVSQVKKMDLMFFGCKDFNCDISNWNVSNVKSMVGTFFDCKSFCQDLGRWDVSHVRFMNETFYMCERLDCDLSSWDLSKVIIYEDVFKACPIKEQYKPKKIRVKEG